MRRKPLVYLAGPYTTGDPVLNTREALLLWERLFKTGVILPFAPHVSMLQHFLTPLAYEEWMSYDLGFIEHCDALFRRPGISSGADRELIRATDLGLPVFDANASESAEADLIRWAKACMGV